MMISFDDAVRIVLSNLPPGKLESVGFQKGLGRILAQDLAATADVPSFRRSAMDGFAVRAADTAGAPLELERAGSIRAGGGDPGSIGAGQAKAIMTGAPLPEGADAVQIVEETCNAGDDARIRILKSVKAGENVAPVGSEAKAGQVVLESGRYLGPAEIAVLAAFGYASVPVWKQPRIAIFSTGDELVEVSDFPRPDQIRNSNAYSLIAQLQLMGLEPEYLGIARDDKNDLRSRLVEGLQKDIVILTGGVSMGEYDFAKEVFLELGLEILFSRVAMKPGKPTVFAKTSDKLIFGLPGNPVSTFIAFENFVRPALSRMCGHSRPYLPRVRGKLLRELKQAPGRTSFLPARASCSTDGWKVQPVSWRGSADIIAFSRANAAAILPSDCSIMAEGSEIDVMLLPDCLWRGI